MLSDPYKEFGASQTAAVSQPDLGWFGAMPQTALRYQTPIIASELLTLFDSKQRELRASDQELDALRTRSGNAEELRARIKSEWDRAGFATKTKELDTSELELSTLKVRASQADGILANAKSSWESAGCPNTQKAEVDGAARKLAHTRSADVAKSRSHFWLRMKLRYLRLAQYFRSHISTYDYPLPLIFTFVGVAFLVLFFLVGILFLHGTVAVMLFGFIGFVCGFLTGAILQFCPHGAGLVDSRAATERFVRQRENEKLIARKMYRECKSNHDALLSAYQITSHYREAESIAAELRSHCDAEAEFNGRIRQELYSLQELDAQYRTAEMSASKLRIQLETEAVTNGRLRQEVTALQARVSMRNRLLGVIWRDLKDVNFEDFLKDVFKELGYHVDKTRIVGDQGVDLVLTKNNDRTAIQAKGYPNTTVGNDAVMQAHTGMRFYKCSKCVVITNSTFTRAAKELAAGVECILIDQSRMEALIRGEIL